MAKIDLKKRRKLEAVEDRLAKPEERQASILPRLLDRFDYFIDHVEGDEKVNLGEIEKGLISLIKEVQKFDDQKMRAKTLDFFTAVIDRFNALQKKEVPIGDVVKELKILQALMQTVAKAIEQQQISVSGSSPSGGFGLNNKSSVRINPATEETLLTLVNAVAQASIATTSNVPAAAISTTLLAVNVNRKGSMFFNDSTDNLFLKFGSGASTTSFTTKIQPGGLYELPIPVFTGIITGIWSGANGSVRITEVET